jgi:hypothetical protein
MPEVHLQAGQIVEVDQNQEVGGRRSVLVQSTVGHTPADANGSHGGNLQDSLLEGLDKGLAIVCRQVCVWFCNHNVSDH